MNWVLLDASFLAYRALHSVGHLEHGDIPTGVAFGFFEQLRRICQDPRVRSNRIAVFCDSRISVRKQEFPGYKAGRISNPEFVERAKAMRSQIDSLTDSALPEIGFPVYRQEGLESDDLIAWMARALTAARAVIITSDSDLFQCVGPRVRWLDPQRDVYWTEDRFEQEKGLAPSCWGEVKAIGGCSTDCVPGVPGVGEITAVRYLRGELPPRSKAYQAITSSEGKRITERNRKLVYLPHQGTKPMTLREPQYRPRAFFRYCRRMGFQSILEKRGAWGRFFSGETFRSRARG